MEQQLKQAIKRIPVVGEVARRVNRLLLGASSKKFPGSYKYWEKRYRRGGNSGAGSYGRLAQFKAEVLNRFVAEMDVRSLIEFGCGDGNQLTLARYPAYLGLDVSKTAVAACRTRFAGDRSKSFHPCTPDCKVEASLRLRGEMAMSLDVIFHLTEDTVYEAYMSALFAAAERFVVVYSSDKDEADEAAHVRHRRFSPWVEENRPEWRLLRKVPNRFPYRRNDGLTSFADFFFYGKEAGG